MQQRAALSSSRTASAISTLQPPPLLSYLDPYSLLPPPRRLSSSCRPPAPLLSLRVSYRAAAAVRSPTPRLSFHSSRQNLHPWRRLLRRARHWFGQFRTLGSHMTSTTLRTVERFGSSAHGPCPSASIDANALKSSPAGADGVHAMVSNGIVRDVSVEQRSIRTCRGGELREDQSPTSCNQPPAENAKERRSRRGGEERHKKQRFATNRSTQKVIRLKHHSYQHAISHVWSRAPCTTYSIYRLSKPW